MKVTFIRSDDTSISIDAEPGDSLMSAATGNLIGGILGECGGGMSCATCHVFVERGWEEAVGRPSLDEAELLETTAEPASKQSRLSCQIHLEDRLDGLTVRLPDRQQ
ncbi:2Fe-2S iron-sulfur cluster-binding protein [Jatrophihabitans sp.]|uniref:2Fe-2S iron-sulfur cluster-binding protein n=1 Tax=Jatrophihabitans sp. TaxID=1932789 RepID=UPI0030C689A8|nr:(2Fe-2S)-binding protein [Jatrophihabitans sp.]